MNRIRGLYYDMDNTIYPQIMDVEQRIDYCIKKFFFANANKAKIFWKQEWLENGPEKDNLIDKVIEKFAPHLDKTEVICYYRSCRTDLFLENEVIVLFERMRSKGVKQFIITNGNQMVQLQKIDLLGLRRYCDEVILAVDEYAKPCPYWFDKLMDKYSLKSHECISVGDRYVIDGLASESAKITFFYKEGGPVKEAVPAKIKRICKLTEIEEYI